MSELSPDHGPHQHAHAAPTTQQMRTIGQRRRDAEEKLEQHLQEARQKEHSHHGDPITQAVPLVEVPGVASQGDAGPPADTVDPNPGR